MKKHKRSLAISMIALPLIASPLVLSAASCNLIVDADTKSCSSDADCVNFANHACNLDTGTCETQDLCSTNDECGDGQVCRPVSPRQCVDLKQGNCQEIYPDDPAVYRNDNAILVGVTAPLTVERSTGLSIANGAKLGVDVFNKDGGVNTADGRRPLVLLICDDKSESQDAYDNGLTLSNIGAQAVIGPAFSGQTIMTAGTADQPGTVANNILLVSPSATSPLVTGIEDDSPQCLTGCGSDDSCRAKCPGLVWRTSPSDEQQGGALAAYFEADLEDVIRKRGGMQETPRTGPITVWVLHKPDAYGDLLTEVIRTTLRFNGAAATTQQNETFFRKVYEDVDQETDGVQPDPAVIAEAIAARPDAVFLIGTSEVAGIMAEFEANWDGNDADRPYYILGDGGLGEPVAVVARETATVAPAAPLIERIRGSVPGPANSSVFDAFSGDYESKFDDPTGGHGPNIFGAAGAYDIAHMIAYSAVAARGAPLTAEQLARGFTLLSDLEAPAITAGSTSVGNATNRLSGGDAINFEGASGSLDFNLATGEAPSPIQIWCVPPANDSGVNTGRYFDGEDVVGVDEPEPDAYSCPFPDP